MKSPDEPAAQPPQWRSTEEVFAALESPLLAYARRLLGDAALAEDVVQDAFMKLHANFDQIAQPQPWLYRAVHNLAVDHQRRSHRVVLAGDQRPDDDSSTVLDDAADSAPMPDEQIARGESIGLVRLVVETLDARSKEIIRLRFDDDLSYGEIAEKMGLKVGYVGYLLHHALKAMAVELQKTEVAR